MCHSLSSLFWFFNFQLNLMICLLRNQLIFENTCKIEKPSELENLHPFNLFLGDLRIKNWQLGPRIGTKVLVLKGFTLCYSYQCPSLEGQAPKQLTNQQTSTIPVNPNNPGGSQYTQAQNPSYLMNKYQNIYLVPYFNYPSSQAF